jgi:endonuclease G
MTKQAWNIELVRAPAGLDLLRGADGSIDWGDIKLCHLDTGYTDHPVFCDPGSGKSCLLPDEGRNFIESGPPLDPLGSESRRGKSFGHGLRTASVICGGVDEQRADGPLAIGVAPGLPLVPCRVVNWVVLHTIRSRERVALGIRHAIDHGCQVVSMSLGTPLWSDALNQAVFAAHERGIILVAAAGQEIDKVTFPARLSRTIACAAVGQNRKPWRPQFWGKHPHEMERIDVWAPGDDVPVATLPMAAAPKPTLLSGSFDSSSNSSSSKGSSYATAHVAAAAAMWLKHRGAEIARTYAKPSQRVEAFRALLKSSSGHLTGLRPKNGSGMLDIEKLLKSPLPPASALG